MQYNVYFLLAHKLTCCIKDSIIGKCGAVKTGWPSLKITQDCKENSTICMVE